MSDGVHSEDDCMAMMSDAVAGGVGIICVTC